MKKENLLITGANGQMGSVLVKELQKIYGEDHVITSDIRTNENFNGIFEILDVTDGNRLNDLVKKHQITQIYHLAAILSANGELNPIQTWDLNMKTFLNILEVSTVNAIDKVFFPSSIAVFGKNAPKIKTPQDFVLTPSTVYGMSKVAGENWAQYYFQKHKLDVRSLRYPGVIGHQSLPGGGTTDYAVDIYHKALAKVDFECYLKNDRTLPMIYMEDAIRATVELMMAPKENINVRTAYNLSGMSFSPEEIATSIQKIYPKFKIKYKIDFRDEIASSWPSSTDDSSAKKDWSWKPHFDIDQMTEIMITELKSTNSKNIKV